MFKYTSILTESVHSLILCVLCLLAKYLIHQWTDFEETFREYSLDTNSIEDGRRCPQKLRDCNHETFTGMVKLNVVVAESLLQFRIKYRAIQMVARGLYIQTSSELSLAHQ